MNVLVLTEALDAGREVAKGFATHESLHAANRLADYLNAVPHGRTVRLACANSSTTRRANSSLARLPDRWILRQGVAFVNKRCRLNLDVITADRVGAMQFIEIVKHFRVALANRQQVMIAAQEDAAGNLSTSAKRALLSVGAGTEEAAALGAHRRSSFAMIGRKGAKPGSVPQVSYRWMCQLYRPQRPSQCIIQGVGFLRVDHEALMYRKTRGVGHNLGLFLAPPISAPYVLVWRT